MGEMKILYFLHLVMRNTHQCTRPAARRDIAARFQAPVLDQPPVKKLLSTEHFAVDATLIEAWASLKSFMQGARSPEVPGCGGWLRASTIFCV